ncbi:DNA polymerase III subunit gamma and tau [Nocardioides sp.]|uniref:DNA polymerase III subunit gamma and tau n=1 Tax=Nocardioides sp. TaxID=35761 RepID=UPI002C855A60|nr:DNA polymerase III subunit gamma and tau [Nocardioides sp.]HSX65951.1 DNA polymerase III subunit gamma and tau [Nocardioides sp.]
MEAPLALYRRYRPETFAEVIGQDHVTEPLRAALANNRVNHAYLFSGPRGCGKTTSARILARALNCEKAPIADPCGECDSCRDLARGGPGSIDVIEIDAASHGGVDDARDLREKAFFAPVRSRYKIYIIDEAHMVTTQGFNALLKLVEEPPPHLRFVFATTEPEKVLPTIRSRTHHYPFRLIPPRLLTSYLGQLCDAEGVAIEQAALPLVVRAGGGSARDTLSVLDQLLGGAGADGVTYDLAAGLLGYTPDSLLDEVVDAFAARDGAGVFGVVDKVIETGQDPRRFTEDLLRRLRDLVIVAAVPDAPSTGLLDVAEDAGERLVAQAQRFGAIELSRAADLVAKGLTEMRGATAPRLLLELICARVLLPGADDTSDGVLARLDRLERRMTISGAAPASAPAAAVGGGAPAGTSPAVAEPAPGATRAAVAEAGAAVAQRGVATAQSGLAAARAAARQVASSVPGAPRQPGPDEGTAAAPAVAYETSSKAPGAPASGSAPSADPATHGWNAVRPGSGGAASGSISVEPTPAAPAAPAGSAAPAAPAAPSAPAASATPAQPAPQSAAPQGSGSRFGLPDVRGLWPTMINEIKGMRRLTWMLLTNNAQVVGVDDTTLTLGFDSAGARDSFTRGDHADLVSKAGVKVVGHAWRVEAIVAQGGPTAPVSAAPVAAVPEPPVDDEPDDPSAEDRRALSAEQAAGSVAAGDRPTSNPAREALRQASSDPGGQAQRPDPYAADAEAHRDDPDVESAGLDPAELLQRELGATIIDEIRHDG